MHFTHRCTIPVERAALSDFLMDVPRVSQCVPGVQEVNALEGEAYGGLLRVKVSPIVLNLRGMLRIGIGKRKGGKHHFLNNVGQLRVEEVPHEFRQKF